MPVTDNKNTRNRPGPDGQKADGAQGIDYEEIADRVLKLLRAELAIERERVGR